MINRRYNNDVNFFPYFFQHFGSNFKTVCRWPFIYQDSQLEKDEFIFGNKYIELWISENESIRVMDGTSSKFNILLVAFMSVFTSSAKFKLLRDACRPSRKF